MLNHELRKIDWLAQSAGTMVYAAPVEASAAQYASPEASRRAARTSPSCSPRRAARSPAAGSPLHLPVSACVSPLRPVSRWNKLRIVTRFSFSRPGPTGLMPLSPRIPRMPRADSNQHIVDSDDDNSSFSIAGSLNESKDGNLRGCSSQDSMSMRTDYSGIGIYRNPSAVSMLRQVNRLSSTALNVTRVPRLPDAPSTNGRRLTLRSADCEIDPTSHLFSPSRVAGIQRSPYVVHPHSLVRVWWDIISMAFLLFNAAVVPLQLCFIDSIPRCPSAFWAFTSVVDWFFALDLVLNCFTIVILEDGRRDLVQVKPITVHYLRTW